MPGYDMIKKNWGGLTMKKIMVSVLVLLLLIPTLSFADSSTQEFVYGAGIRFGMSLEQAKAIDGDADTETDDTLIYNATIAGLEGYVAYFFTDDQLTEIYIAFTAEKENDNDYVSDFENIDVALKAKYGDPTIDNFYSWQDNAKVSVSGGVGQAVRDGYLTILTDWEVFGVDIAHVLTEYEDTISHGITYIPMETETDSTPNTKGL